MDRDRYDRSCSATSAVSASR